MSEEQPIKTSRSRTPRKPKKNQLLIGILAIIVIAVATYLLSRSASALALFLLFGVAFGFILQKSRFCFTASMRDPWITGSTSLTKAVLLAFFITTIGFTAIKYGAYVNGDPIPGMGYVVPISFATVVGGLMFGTGMVIAGGCASGTLMRVGEGFGMQMLSLVFFVVGSFWGAHDFGFWKINFIVHGPKVFLPDVFGWLGALLLQSAVIGLLYIAADKWEKKKMGLADGA